MIQQITNQLKSYHLRRRCIVCLDKTTQTIPLCNPCQQMLPIVQQPCRVCGQTILRENNLTPLCGSCVAQLPYFEHTIAPFDYQPPISTLVAHLKFKRQLGHAKILAYLLIPHLHLHYAKRLLPECIIPVPLHRSRLQQRGFNQALQIAKYIGKSLTLPIDYNSAIRCKATAAQATLSAKQRAINIKGAFHYSAPKTIKRVAVVDDVVTTGNTVNALCKQLKRQGVTTIDIWAIARAQWL